MLADDRGWRYDLVVQFQIERGDVMRKFWRRKKAAEAGTASTFVEATGGGWGDLPDSVPSDGGEQFDQHSLRNHDEGGWVRIACWSGFKRDGSLHSLGVSPEFCSRQNSLRKHGAILFGNLSGC